SGVFNWTGGAQIGSGVTSIASGAFLNVTNGGNLELTGRTLRNSGTVFTTGESFAQGAVFNNGLIENLAGAVFEVQGNGGFFDVDGVPATPVFRNEGTFRLTAGGTVSFAGVAFTNSGSASLEAGNCQFG